MLHVMRLYMKFAMQVIATVLVALVAALQDDRVDAAEWINVVIVLLGAVSVLGAGNLPDGVWRYTKTIVAAATAALTLLVSFVSDGGVITGSEWLQVAIAAFGAVGVLAVKGPVVIPADMPGGRGVVA
jgi:drug/metabolite transporter (DMT)-like permease